MNQKVEQAAIAAAEDCYEMPYDENYINMKLIKESFESGVEWQKKQSPWVSVEERLPEDSEIVLTKPDDVKLMWNELAMTWDDLAENFYCDRFNITHWMSIPKFNQ